MLWIRNKILFLWGCISIFMYMCAFMEERNMQKEFYFIAFCQVFFKRSRWVFFFFCISESSILLLCYCCVVNKTARISCLTFNIYLIEGLLFSADFLLKVNKFYAFLLSEFFLLSNSFNFWLIDFHLNSFFKQQILRNSINFSQFSTKENQNCMCSCCKKWTCIKNSYCKLGLMFPQLIEIRE